MLSQGTTTAQQPNSTIGSNLAQDENTESEIGIAKASASCVAVSGVLFAIVNMKM